MWHLEEPKNQVRTQPALLLHPEAGMREPGKSNRQEPRARENRGLETDRMGSKDLWVGGRAGGWDGVDRGEDIEGGQETAEACEDISYAQSQFVLDDTGCLSPGRIVPFPAL